MNILLINPYDVYGGAEKLAFILAYQYSKLKHNVRFVVNHKFSQSPLVMEIPGFKTAPMSKIFIKSVRNLAQTYFGNQAIRKFARTLEEPGGIKRIITGRELIGKMDICRMVKNINFTPDIIHFHNMRGGSFGPGSVYSASILAPVVLTLHDLWLLTGKCIQPDSCDRWKHSCKNCLYSGFVSPIAKTGIMSNLQRKKFFLSQAEFHICTPSEWLMQIVKKSYLAELADGFSVIPNGVDISVFKPGDKKHSREKLNIPEKSAVILSSGREIKTNRYKNFKVLEEVARLLSNGSSKRRILIMCLGDSAKTQVYGNVKMEFRPFQNDENTVAEYYRAADVYVSTSTCEAWGLAVSEAMACGTPVIGFSDTALQEQVINGKTGFLVEKGRADKMANIIITILNNINLQRELSISAGQYAAKSLSIEKTARMYIELYSNLIKKKKQ